MIAKQNFVIMYYLWYHLQNQIAMREYAKKPESQSRTLDSNPQASRQAPIDVILQRYKERNIQRFAEDEELIQGKFNDTVQRNEIEEDELLQDEFESVLSDIQRSIQREERSNNTGLPDNLKEGVENLSGFSMDDVRVHYNSDKPVQLNALAYAQGTDIHVGPGQEKHLPHEAWHVLQQKQRRVQPTMQMQGINVNDNEELEKEADKMSNSFSQKVRGEKPINVSIQKKSDTIQRVPIPLTTEILTELLTNDNISALLESTRIRKDTTADFPEFFTFKTTDQEFKINKEGQDDLWELIKSNYNQKEFTETNPLYEFLSGEIESDKKIIFPGITSCLGISYFKGEDDEEKLVGSHLVYPTNDEQKKQYGIQIKKIVDDVFGGGINELIENPNFDILVYAFQCVKEGEKETIEDAINYVCKDIYCLEDFNDLFSNQVKNTLKNASKIHVSRKSDEDMDIHKQIEFTDEILKKYFKIFTTLFIANEDRIEDKLEGDNDHAITKI